MIGELFGIDGKQLATQYKEYISGFRQWSQLYHAQDFVIFKENIGRRISMDETCLSQGELYTIITNKDAKGKKGALIAMIKGTNSDVVSKCLKKIAVYLRLRVKEITIDLSPSMKLICKKSFPNSTIVSDRFHVQKLMNEAVSDMRIKHRWDAIDKENEEIKSAKAVGKTYKPNTYENGDTVRQLLARSRHVVMMHFSKWTQAQAQRAEILFREYPDIHAAYQVSMNLTEIYNTTNCKMAALTKLAHWYEDVELLDNKIFNSVINTMQNNYGSIVNYFDNRSTNASAESFNAKVKAFRSQFRGVRDIPFFIFRLAKIFA